MTTQEITNRQNRDAMKYELALSIRKLLDDAKKAYKQCGGSWDDDDMESEIQTLVFEE